MQAGSGWQLAGVALAASMAASAQSLLSPDAIDQARSDFASAATAPRLRCAIAPVRPALNYSLQFQTGYVIDVPLTQFHGKGHGLKVLLRVTPEGGAPAYLTSSELLPEVPETSGDGEFTGTFLVGDGKYLVETMAGDDAGRVCSSKWRIEAKRSGSERELIGAMRPGAVGEVSPPWSSATEAAGPLIDRLTILLDAAPLNPRAAKLEEETAAMLRDSVGSLLVQLPAKRVRLVAFNPDQQAVLLQKDEFGTRDLEQLTTAFDKLQVAAVDYRKLQSGQKTDVVGDLVGKELRDARPASAVIFLGPRTSWKADGSLEPAVDTAGPGSPRWFYLEFQRPPEWPGHFERARQGGRRAVNMGIPTRADGSEPIGPLRFGAGPDWIEQWLRRLKGETLVVRNPHELADAIRHMAAEIPKTVSAMDAETAAPAPAPMPPRRPFLLGSSDPDVADEIKAAPRPDAADVADPIEVLMRLRDQVLEHGVKVPNHTCVETVERDMYEPVAAPGVASCDTLLARRRHGNPPLRRNTTDRLRLDVRLAGGREIYSWVGAPKFEDRDLDELVPQGAIGTGPFAGMLLGVFEKRDPEFRFEGDVELDGRLLAYSYEVPRPESQYRVRTHNGAAADKQWIVTGYTGRLLVDPATAELVRLTVRTEELPASTDACEMDTTLEYGLVALGGFDYLLRKFARQRFLGSNGSEAENRLEFASCREYRGESTLEFGAVTAAGGTAAAGTLAPLVLPAGLALTVDLAAPVLIAQAAAGDRIVGRLSKPVLDGQRKTTLAPEGARIEGRLMRVEVRHARGEEHAIALRWETLEIDGAKVPLELKPNRPVPLRAETPIELPRPGEERYGVYHLPGQTTVIESGFRTE